MLEINQLDRIYVGIEGEAAARTIRIDVSAWMVSHPDAAISLWHRRHGDEAMAATGASYDEDTQQLVWTPSATDTFYPGEGEAQIRLTETGIIKKTLNIKTFVSPADVGSDGNTIPSTWAGYINEVERIKGLAVTAKNAAEAAQEAAEDAQEAAEIAAGIAIAQAGQIKFFINDEGHLIFAYTDQVPVGEEDEENE